MSKYNWHEITIEDVKKAIQIFLADNPDYPEPKTTFLVYEGKKLPAKHIRGMSYAVHFGQEISKNDYSGGLETVKFFEKLGFEMDYQGSDVKKTATITMENKQPKPLHMDRKQKSGKKDDVSEKISIPSKNVIEQKNALQLLLNKLFDGDIVCEKTFDWLRTPKELTGIYLNLYKALSSYRGDTTFAKKNVSLRCDFVCESKKLIIEYDERQHFSEARRVSLESYRNVPVLFDRNMWIKACVDINAKDNAPANRDEVRAFYDSVRDIACYENGYKLLRIMHGQIDFEKPEAALWLKEVTECILEEKPSVKNTEMTDNDTIKIAMYLQTNELKNKAGFDSIFPLMKTCDADIIVFPEFCYVPFVKELVCRDIFEFKDLEEINGYCLSLSKELGKAIVVSSHDKYGTIFSLFANAYAKREETKTNLYVKHTMTDASCLELEDYNLVVPELFEPISYKGFLIGMTICYDCNHALFSRMYGYYGIDIIINSTGGDVVYDKWYKYNKARAIENCCYTLVTMGGNGNVEKPHNYVFGFNKNGGEIIPVNLNGNSDRLNVSGGLYMYEISKEPGCAEEDMSNPFETENKKWQLKYPLCGSVEIIKSSNKITEAIYHKKVGNNNVFFLLVDGEDIMKPEIVQPLLYDPKLKQYLNKKYVIINRFNKVDESFFHEKLSIILKVRAMENFCAVVLESDNITKCYQCGKNRTAQVVKDTEGFFGIDLERASGPEAIWKNKQGMKAVWRTNYEWLVHNATHIYE